MNPLTKDQRLILTGAVGFGVTFALNAILILLLTRLRLGLTLARLVNPSQIFDELLVILITNLVLLGLAGALTGWIGSRALSREMPRLATKKFGWYSAVSFGASQAIVILPLLFFTALVGFYEKNIAQNPLDIMLLTTTYAAVYGLVLGLCLGFLTVNWRHSWRILLGSVIGFGLGGFLAGFFVWLGLADKLAWLPNSLLFVLALTTMGLVGGAALATAYYRVESLTGQPSAGKTEHRWLARLEKVAIVIGAIMLLNGVLNAYQMLQVQEAPLNEVISLPTVGTHFADPVAVRNATTTPALFASPDGQPFLVWMEENDVYYAWQEDGSWANPVNVSGSAAQSMSPQGAAEAGGQGNMVWAEEGQIMFSQCIGGACIAPVVLPAPACAPGNGRDPVIAWDSGGLIMVAWETDEEQLGYAAWNSGEQPENAEVGCVGKGQNPRLTASGNNTFQLAADTSDMQILQAQFDGLWQMLQPVGIGHSPEINADAQGQVHMAWCAVDARVIYQNPQMQQTAVDFPPCADRPGIGQDGSGQLHLVWSAGVAEKNTGVTSSDQAFLYESVLTDSGWSDPAIISTTSALDAVSLTAAADGILHLAWNNGSLAYASQTPYSCGSIEPQTEAGQRVLEALSQPKFHPPDQPVPYCQNRYDTLLYTPNPDPAFSSQPPRTNSAFEYMRDLMETAEYEALFATMQWVPDENGDSPGFVIAQGVASLYEKLKADPSQYPRGLTVRLLVGNMPAFDVFQTNNQVWNILADLREAGVPEMVNEDIGWRVQVANFSGLWPHSHAKLIVIDGETVVAKGINVSYLHYPIDNPSGQGLGMVDYAIMATGPVAQHAVATFDDLWNGSHEVVCDNMNPLLDKLWLVTCDRVTAVPEHTPEALKFTIPAEADDIVFSQYRSHVHFASDEAVLAALSTADKSLDIFEVNFTLDLICDAGIVFNGVCNFEDHALPFMRQLMDQIDTNHIPVRILVEEEAMDGMENKVAIQAFVAELEKRGLTEYVDIHFYNGKMHAKGFIVDDEFLVVGSQNFQYSSWGDEALNEYNLSTENEEAIQTFKHAFEFYWADSTPAEEVMTPRPFTEKNRKHFLSLSSLHSEHFTNGRKSLLSGD